MIQVGGPGSCPGDSGGPLVRFVTNSARPHYVQMSVVHGGVGRCGSKEFPGVYGRVAQAKVLKFIKEQTGLDEGAGEKALFCFFLVKR